eukprot:TRINITY_DN19429_c1_g1_i1.p1 TRINITY_DN19429_c1_g1~~TRINITY_DN19429_c1_g1_i1.p1  ORF type:complete len:157 (-),score=52.17 TRINITY_DN19429_c1_g1_i1:114-584(-)
MDKEDRKKAAKDQKKQVKTEQEKAKEKYEYEQFNIKEKDDTYKNKQQRKAEMEKEKEEKAKERNAAAVSGKVKHSKPEPARPPFGFFKEDHADWDAEKVKEEWGKLDEAGKAAYKNKANADKERYKKEMEEYNKVQDQLAQQKAAGGGDRQKRGKH